MEREKRYLGDGEHYFIIRPDKYSGMPLAELFDSSSKRISMVTVGEMTIHQLINHFEVLI